MDANVRVDSGQSVDGSVDAGTGDAALDVDAGPLCAETCTTDEACMVGVCDTGVCAIVPVPDGVDCGEFVGGLPTGVCVSGACVTPRGCGDGYREPGPVADELRPAAERCDDGNLLTGDACSSSCEPTSVPLTSVGVDPATDEETLSVSNSARPTSALGVDGSGKLLAVWSEERFPLFDAPYTLGRAQRFDATGRPVGTVIELGFYTDVSAVGVEQGWALSADSSELLYVAPSGSVTMVSALPSDAFDVSLQPVLTPDGPGALLVYGVDSGRSLRADAEVRAQRWAFSAARLSRLSDHLVATNTARRTWSVSSTTHGSDWAVHYTTWSPVGTTPDERDVRIRRYSGATELTPTHELVFSGSTTDYAAGIGYVAATGDTGYALALITNETDVRGDVEVHYVQPDGSVVAPSIVDAAMSTSALRSLRIGAHPVGEGAYLLMQHDSTFVGLTLYTGSLDVAASPGATPWTPRAQLELMALAPSFALYDSSFGMPSMTASGDTLWIFWSGTAFGHSGMHLYSLRD